MTDINLSSEKLIENAPIGIFQVPFDSAGADDPDTDPDQLYVNDALAEMLDFDSPEQLRSQVELIEYADPEEEEAFFEELQSTDYVEAFETTLVTNEDRQIEVILSGTLEDGEISGYLMDITEQKRLRRKAREQAEAILEQSTPIVQIWDGITLATVVGTLDTSRAQQLTEELLVELKETESDVALLDITGVPDVDTATAQHLIDTVNAVSLLGSEVIITGINPNIAQTLVQLGITMENIRTKSSLSEGLELGLAFVGDDVAGPNEAD